MKKLKIFLLFSMILCSVFVSFENVDALSKTSLVYLPTGNTKTYLISSGKVATYNINTKKQLSTYVYGWEDVVTIKAVYSDGWTKINYPVGKSYVDALVKTQEIFLDKSGYYRCVINSNLTVYTKYNTWGNFGTVSKGTNIYVIGTKDDRVQICYNLSNGGYKIGWIGKTVLKDNHQHVYDSATGYEAVHPHKVYKRCIVCNSAKYTGDTKKLSSCSKCEPVHTHKYINNGYYEAAHPHKYYEKCSCGATRYTGKTKKLSNCAKCKPVHTHKYINNGYYEAAHPHKYYEKCSCGATRYTGKTKKLSNCAKCNPNSSWDNKVGKTLANINSAYYYGKLNLSYSTRKSLAGQCTWYCYGRFRELTGIGLKKARNAKYWLTDNKSDSRVKVLYGSSNIKEKAIAVRTSGTYGHVMFIEGIKYENGKPKYVYFTECNADGNGVYNKGKDCILKKMSYKDFINKKKPAGYIIKK